MKPEAQRIAIAEACGWEHRPDLNPVYCWWHTGLDEHNGFKSPPDYLNDLNAMRDAEGCLTYCEEYVYRLCLNDITNGAVYRATAAQRAEAFLRTIGKWTED